MNRVVREKNSDFESGLSAGERRFFIQTPDINKKLRKRSELFIYMPRTRIELVQH